MRRNILKATAATWETILTGHCQRLCTADGRLLQPGGSVQTELLPAEYWSRNPFRNVSCDRLKQGAQPPGTWRGKILDMVWPGPLAAGCSLCLHWASVHSATLNLRCQTKRTIRRGLWCLIVLSTGDHSPLVRALSGVSTPKMPNLGDQKRPSFSPMCCFLAREGDVLCRDLFYESSSSDMICL